MKYKILTLLFILFFIVSVLPNSFADNEIEFQTDESIYYLRDTISLCGDVKYLQNQDFVFIEIEDSNGNVVFQTATDLDLNTREFVEDITLIDSIWNEGEYSIITTFRDSSTQQRILIFPSQGTEPEYIASSISFDKPFYSLNDKVRITIDSPSLNQNSKQIEPIGFDETITIYTSKGTLPQFHLTETTRSSGIFSGTVTLTGDSDLDLDRFTHADDMSGETRENGRFDGFLGAYNNDRIYVTFSNEHETITESVPIHWNLASITVENDESIDGNVLVRVIDPDMNFNSNRPDTVFLENDFTLVETSAVSGIFEKSFIPSYGMTSVVYKDITIPGPRYSSSLVSAYLPNSFVIESEEQKTLDMLETIKQWYSQGIISDVEFKNKLFSLVVNNLITYGTAMELILSI